MNIAGIASKLAGIAGLTMITYDANTFGCIKGRENAKNASVALIPDAFINTRKLNSPTTVGEKLKHLYYDKLMRTDTTHNIGLVTGYVKGTLTHMWHNIIPLSLAAGAAFLKKTPSKICAGLLAAYGVKYVLTDVLNLKSKKIFK